MTTFVSGVRRSPADIEAAYVRAAVIRFLIVNDGPGKPDTIGKGFAYACAVSLARAAGRRASRWTHCPDCGLPYQIGGHVCPKRAIT